MKMIRSQFLREIYTLKEYISTLYMHLFEFLSKTKSHNLYIITGNEFYITAFALAP